MKNIILNSDMLHLDLDHQSDCLFSQIRLSTAIRNYGGHAPRAIKMSRILSHSATAWKNYIPSFKQLFKEETHVKGFVLLSVGVCIDLLCDDSQLCLVCVHSLITHLQLKKM